VERCWNPEGRHDEVLNIADAIMDAGGLPKLIYIGAGEPREQMTGLNALAIPGGRDVDPASYKSEMGPHMDPAEPDKAFDNFEIACIQNAFDTGMPMLGHCRGAQITNVAGGGTMTQDIPTEFELPEGWGSKYGTRIDHRPEATRHDYAQRPRPAHFVVVGEGSRMAGMVGLLEAVNSIHHQCIAAVSPLLIPVCHALDGLVEGFERKGMPWQSGYQFHAEAMRYTDKRYQGVYENLVNDGAKFKNGELFVPASAIQVGPGYESNNKAQRSWLMSQAQQRFGVTPNELMESEVGQAHFVGMAEEWRLAHPLQ
jgi:gamma-glutamyl-gamma-aminobutyrate hydrolase PuuD